MASEHDTPRFMALVSPLSSILVLGYCTVRQIILRSYRVARLDGGWKSASFLFYDMLAVLEELKKEGGHRPGLRKK